MIVKSLYKHSVDITPPSILKATREKLTLKFYDLVKY